MHRLFVAIDLPDDVKKTVGALCSGLPGARWVPIGQLHLTLRFIGEVDERTFAAVRKVLAEVVGASFPLTLSGAGHFPPGRSPRVLWVGMERSGPLLELHQKVERALSGAGIAPDERRFSPHITIARLKETPAPGVAAFDERHSALRAGPFVVDEFYLYSSTLTREGAIHMREAVYPLANTG